MTETTSNPLVSVMKNNKLFAHLFLETFCFLHNVDKEQICDCLLFGEGETKVGTDFIVKLSPHSKIKTYTYN